MRCSFIGRGKLGLCRWRCSYHGKEVEVVAPSGAEACQKAHSQLGFGKHNKVMNQ